MAASPDMHAEEALPREDSIRDSRHSQYSLESCLQMVDNCRREFKDGSRGRTFGREERGGSHAGSVKQYQIRGL